MRFNSVAQWLAWQETLNPREIELGLERVGQVYARLDLTNFKPFVITVGGTNGKGSCVALLSAILTNAGYRVGAYTSPHLLRYNERIRLNEVDIDDAALCRAFQAVDDARGDTPLTYFEFGTLAAFYLFADAMVQVMVLEVGLGGRLDAVNIIDADVALISSIGIDHTDWLGPDRTSIAREKAGILRAGKPLVCGDTNPPAVVFEIAERLRSPVALVNRDFTYQSDSGMWSWQGHESRFDGLPKPAVSGGQQLQNAASVLAVLESLGPHLAVTRQHIINGLLQMRLAGRCQIVGHAPLVIVDVAHNPQAATVLAGQLPALIQREQGGADKVHAVFAVLADKDIAGIVSALSPCVDEWHVASLPVPRGATAEQLCNQLHTAGIQAVHTYDRVSQAFNVALEVAGERDCIVVCGSFYTVADVLLPLLLPQGA